MKERENLNSNFLHLLDFLILLNLILIGAEASAKEPKARRCEFLYNKLNTFALYVKRKNQDRDNLLKSQED